MSHDEWLERADVYALDALDGEERIGVEDHIASGCPECDQRIRETREAILQIPLSLRLQAPSPAVKRRLMDALAREAPALRSPPIRTSQRAAWARLGFAASVLFLLGLSGYVALDNWTIRRQLRDRDAEAKLLRSQLVQRKDVIRYL
jgi:hypothetical protein